jgi:hypothetical protein
MDPTIAALAFIVLVLVRFMIPVAAIFTLAKLVDRYFPAY